MHDVITKIETQIKVASEKQDKAIIDAVKQWTNNSPAFRSAFLIDEDKLKEILILGVKEYERIHKEPAKLGIKYTQN